MTPWSSIGYLTYKRTYARPIGDRTEEWPETIQRVLNACDTQLKVGFTEAEKDRVREYMEELKFTVAGRFLWQLGTDTVEQYGLASLQNCAFVKIDEPVRPFCWTMDMLALGCGVGFSIQKEHVSKLPVVRDWFKAPERVNDAGADFIVPDSRQGWVKLLGKTLKAAFLSQNRKSGSFTYSTQVVRGKGTPIKGFGGVACLTGDTVLYKDRKKSQTANEITIEELFEMQHSLGFWEGKPNHFNKVKIRSLDEESGAFFRNRVLNVIYNGEAPVYEIITDSGYKIRATENHRFMKDDGRYEFLSNFSEGDLIAVNGTDVKPRKQCRACGASVAATCHACKMESRSKDGLCKDCGEPVTRWAARCKSCVDKLQLRDDATDTSARGRKACRDYLAKHEACEICGAKGRLSVHHNDKDPRNNAEENLTVVCDQCHRETHAVIDSYGNAYKHRYVSFDSIRSITYVGVEPVYDLQMEGPNHNFVANGFVSHNSGPEDLVWGIGEISKILDKRKGRKIRPVDALDLMNIIGAIIVAGNVRRSAEICLGDPEDIEYLLSKRWDFTNIPSWRAMSNNSVVVSNIDDLHDYFWEGYEGKGEPFGLVNLRNARKMGRTGEFQYPDPTVEGVNPCSEQSLANYETCVSYDTRIQTKEGAIKIGEIVGKEIEVWNGEQWSKVTPFLAKPKDLVFRVFFDDGSHLDANADHEFSVRRNKSKIWKKVKLQDLIPGEHALPKFNIVDTVGNNVPEAYMWGAFAGDGYVDGSRAIIYTPESKYSLIAHYGDKVLNIYKEQHREGLESHSRVVVDINLAMAKQLRDRDQGLPEEIFRLDKKSSLAFIAGLIDTDGNVRNTNGTESYAIYSTCLKKLQDLQIVMRRANINSTSIIIDISKDDKGNYGRNHNLYKLSIYSFDCTEVPTKLKKASAFGSRYMVNNAHPSGALIDKAKSVKVTAIEALGEMPVYCFSEPLRHMGVFNNVLTHQCCLSELFLPNIQSEEEFLDILELTYRINKHSLMLPSHHSETEKIVHRNMRMGIGLTGILQATPEQMSWLDGGYKFLRDLDVRYSELHNVPTSVKLTTVKPSGTLSLLPGVTPGAHPAYARFMIRRIRIAADHNLVKTCKTHGYNVEYVKNFDGSKDRNTVVVEFPFRYPDNAILASEMTAIDQLEVIRKLQKEWSDNAVSVTVYYKKEEIPQVKEYLRQHWATEFKSLSFLLHSEHGFQQAPYEEITEERYNEIVAKTKLITRIDQLDFDETDPDCATGACPVR